MLKEYRFVDNLQKLTQWLRFTPPKFIITLFNNRILKETSTRAGPYIPSVEKKEERERKKRRLGRWNRWIYIEQKLGKSKGPTLSEAYAQNMGLCTGRKKKLCKFGLWHYFEWLDFRIARLTRFKFLIWIRIPMFTLANKNIISGSLRWNMYTQCTVSRRSQARLRRSSLLVDPFRNCL